MPKNKNISIPHGELVGFLVDFLGAFGAPPAGLVSSIFSGKHYPTLAPLIDEAVQLAGKRHDQRIREALGEPPKG